MKMVTATPSPRPPGYQTSSSSRKTFQSFRLSQQKLLPIVTKLDMYPAMTHYTTLSQHMPRMQSSVHTCHPEDRGTQAFPATRSLRYCPPPAGFLPPLSDPCSLLLLIHPTMLTILTRMELRGVYQLIISTGSRGI